MKERIKQGVRAINSYYQRRKERKERKKEGRRKERKEGKQEGRKKKERMKIA